MFGYSISELGAVGETCPVAVQQPRIPFPDPRVAFVIEPLPISRMVVPDDRVAPVPFLELLHAQSQWIKCMQTTAQQNRILRLGVEGQRKIRRCGVRRP